MNHAIQTLKTRASEIKQKKLELENIEPEMQCDLDFADTEIKNLELLLKEVNDAIILINNQYNK